MKLAISNIAWPSEKEERYLGLIKEWGCSGVEIAPTRIWSDPLKASLEQRRCFVDSIHKHGLEISAMQALLYGRRDLGLFRSADVETETIDYLKGLCKLSAVLGAKVLVFGSPANRKRGDIPLEEAFERAALFFSKVAPVAEKLGVCLCIEPLRPQETDFITTAGEGLRLVELVNNPGFGLHLDAKAVAEEGSDFVSIFKSAIYKLKHFHINDPGLIEVNSTGLVDHISITRALRKVGYRGYVSIEMRTLPDCDDTIKRSVQFSKKTYIDY
ncbi:MAG: sugar phosphate isomerase/epimerase [Candidatus Omnitrophica bacterium]|nr:sugar phosphate isomerase/epimerase [Candidatus Omnitrophota bacterium]